MRPLTVLLLLVAGSLCAQEPAPAAAPIRPPAFERTWKISLAALAGASAADAASSLGRCCEMNPLLAPSNGRFGASSALIKAGAVGVELWLQRSLIAHHPRLAKPFAIVNFVTAGLLTSVAVHNLRNH
jgi:hypothetical protein